MTTIGAPAGPIDVMKSIFSTNTRLECRTRTMTSRARAAISGAPPAPGRRTFGEP